MKVVVSSSGPGLEAAMDGRFGRCAYFVLVDTETGDVGGFANDAASAAGGAGIAAATAVARSGVEAAITGNVGPNAIRTLSELGIKVYSCAGGTVGQAVEAFKAGNCQEMGAATAPSKSGMGGAGRGAGGFGGGRGGGGGRGAGGGGGRGAGGGRA